MFLENLVGNVDREFCIVKALDGAERRPSGLNTYFWTQLPWVQRISVPNIFSEFFLSMLINGAASRKVGSCLKMLIKPI